MKTIFEYSNYRIFLKEYYAERKSLEGYTYRDFARSTGMNSSSWLMHLIRGTKNLSDNSAQLVARTLKLSRHESEYFLLLVSFTQAVDNKAKNHFYQQMIDLKKKLKIIKISEEQYEYYSQWYYPVVRSLVSKVAWKNNYAMLAKNLLPKISTAQAKKSVMLLERLGFIEKMPNGSWRQKNDLISTGDEVMSLNIVNYHKQILRLAENAFDIVPKNARDISSLTMGINEKDMERIKTKVQEFRKQIMDIARASDRADRVYQLNFQFFPVSSWKDEQS